MYFAVEALFPLTRNDQSGSLTGVISFIQVYFFSFIKYWISAEKFSLHSLLLSGATTQFPLLRPARKCLSGAPHNVNVTSICCCCAKSSSRYSDCISGELNVNLSQFIKSGSSLSFSGSYHCGNTITRRR